MADNDPYPTPVSDPAADGLPETADPDSQAFDEVMSPRLADGPDPAPLPPDREDGPMALDEYGTTPREQRDGEPLDLRLSRESPDVSPDSVPLDPEPRLAEEADPDALGQLADDSQNLVDDDPVDPRLDSEVSVYDRVVPGVPETAKVGRLVQPDEGAHEDSEPDEVAYDAGASGGGASAEESAIHEVPPE